MVLNDPCTFHILQGILMWYRSVRVIVNAVRVVRKLLISLEAELQTLGGRLTLESLKGD